MGHKRNLSNLETALDYKFKDLNLLKLALTHKSASNEIHPENNERLEFLGDAVLQIIVSDHLYHTYPDLAEGQLAKIRALLVSQPTLANKARDLGLNNFLRVGKGEERTLARERDSLLCDTYEAVLGAIYLDSDIDTVRPIIIKNLRKWNKDQLLIVDAKSTLQEYLQQTSKTTPTYSLAKEYGPDHEKEFVVEVSYEEKMLGRGVGRSKKEAAQNAAREALRKLDIQ